MSFLTPQPRNGGRRASISFAPVPDIQLFDESECTSSISRGGAGAVAVADNNAAGNLQSSSSSSQNTPRVTVVKKKSKKSYVATPTPVTNRPSTTATKTKKKSVDNKNQQPPQQQLELQQQKQKQQRRESFAIASQAAAMHSAAWAPYFEDQVLASRKVYITSLYRSSIVIQKRVRGYLQRRHYARLLVERGRELVQITAARRVQRLFRRWYGRRQAARNQAAVRLQALVRGHLARLRRRLRLLERQLARVERQRCSDRARIELWKREQLAELQKLVDEEVDRYCRQRAQARLKMDTVMELRLQNETLRQEHDELAEQIAELESVNQKLSREADLYHSGTSTVRQALKQVQADAVQWHEVHDLYEERVLEYQQVVEERELVGQIEHNVKRRYESTLRRIKRHLESNLLYYQSSSIRSSLDSDSDDDYDQDHSSSSEDGFSGDVLDTYTLLQKMGLFEKLQSSCANLHSSLVELGFYQ